MMNAAILRFLEALHQATERRLLSWAIVQDEERNPNEDRELFSADVAGQRVEIELVYFQAPALESFERMLATVSGSGVYFNVAVGTPAYDLIGSMLSMSIHGWDKGRDGALSELAKATARVHQLLGDAS